MMPPSSHATRRRRPGHHRSRRWSALPGSVSAVTTTIHIANIIALMGSTVDAQTNPDCPVGTDGPSCQYADAILCNGRGTADFNGHCVCLPGWAPEDVWGPSACEFVFEVFQ